MSRIYVAPIRYLPGHAEANIGKFATELGLVNLAMNSLALNRTKKKLIQSY